MYFSASFPEIPPYCNCILYNTKLFSCFSRSSPVLWKESGLSFSLTFLPFLSFHLCPIASSKKTSFPTCHLKPRLWETPPFPPPARATGRAQHAAAGATPVASTSQGTTGGFRLNHISQAFAPSTNLAASSPALRELPRQVEHPARRGAGGKGRWRKRSATCAGRERRCARLRPSAGGGDLGKRGACALRLTVPNATTPLHRDTREPHSSVPSVSLSPRPSLAQSEQHAAVCAPLWGQPPPSSPGRANFPSDNRSDLPRGAFGKWAPP